MGFPSLVFQKESFLIFNNCASTTEPLKQHIKTKSILNRRVLIFIFLKFKSVLSTKVFHIFMNEFFSLNILSRNIFKKNIFDGKFFLRQNSRDKFDVCSFYIFKIHILNRCKPFFYCWH